MALCRQATGAYHCEKAVLEREIAALKAERDRLEMLYGLLCKTHQNEIDHHDALKAGLTAVQKMLSMARQDREQLEADLWAVVELLESQRRTICDCMHATPPHLPHCTWAVRVLPLLARPGVKKVMEEVEK